MKAQKVHNYRPFTFTGARQGKDVWSAKVTEEIVKQIFKDRHELTQKQIAEKYLISVSAVNSILNRRTWFHVRIDE